MPGARLHDCVTLVLYAVATPHPPQPLRCGPAGASTRGMSRGGGSTPPRRIGADGNPRLSGAANAPCFLNRFDGDGNSLLIKTDALLLELERLAEALEGRLVIVFETGVRRLGRVEERSSAGRSGGAG
jgi:hypothetical protein